MSWTGVRYALQMAARHSFFGHRMCWMCTFISGLEDISEDFAYKQAGFLSSFLFQDVAIWLHKHAWQVFCPSDEQCHPPGNCQNCVDRTYPLSW